MFVDEAQICVQGGDGGAGCASFLREFRRPKGGPDGGDGGRGGDVVMVADQSVASLMRFTNEIHHKAQSGKHGSGKTRHGRRGSGIEIHVPTGTVVRRLDGELVADLVHPGDSFTCAPGGRGGRGNARFLSNARRAPSFAEQGEPGEEQWLRLELRLLADVALVGFPNSGKSTFISAVSAAKPKIADYPFTTLEPHLGVVRRNDEELVIADIPGLIEGAAQGKGLGHKFLRHIQRARVLLLLLDPLNLDLSEAEQAVVLDDELRSFDPELAGRPRLSAVTKADTVPDPDALAFGDARVISAASGYGMDDLIGTLMEMVEHEREAEPEIRGRTVGYELHKPEQSAISVRRDGGAWTVEGPAARRAVAVNDLTDPQALAYVQVRLRSLGVDDALANAGCRAGDEVRIGDLVFEYEPDAS